MLSYFAFITLVKLSGLLIPFIWFLIIANRRGRILSIMAVILLFIVSYINTYFNLPDLAYPSLIDGWLMWFISGMLLVAVLRRFLYQKVTEETQANSFDGIIRRFTARFGGTVGWLSRLILVGVIAIVIFIILGSFTSLFTQMNPRSSVSTIKTDMNSNAKKAPMPVIKGGSETPVVNAPQTVSTDMNNSLNSFKNSNVYDLNHMRVQIYRNKMVYVAPIEFSGGFWRYLHYLQVPGYFRTDATNKSADPQFVAKPMRYTPSAYFNNDADRRISAHSLGYSRVGGTSQLEIDDNGTPYYVRTLAKPISYFNRNFDYSDYRVAVLNTINGQVNVYKPNQVPKFIDIAVSPDWVSQEVQMFGKYRHGFWNATSFGGHTGVMKPTTAGTEGGDHLTPFAYKGRVYYFTGMTSINNQQSSILGYTFVDARNNTLHYYKESGNVMTPERAISYAQQDINPQNYRGALPLLYRINGDPTWVVSMLDRENNSFMKFVYLLADGNNQSNTYAVGNDAQSTLDIFNQRIAAKTGASIPVTGGKTVKGNIYRISKTSDNKIIFILKNNPEVYEIDTTSKAFKPMYQFVQQGDSVTFKSTSTSGNNVATQNVDITTFKDSSLTK